MFRKMLLSSILALLVLSIGVVASDNVLEQGENIQPLSTANIFPSSQTIYGSSQWANWTLTWSFGNAPWSIYFNPGDGSGNRLIDSRTNYTSMNHSYQYNSQDHMIQYRPTLRVIDRDDFMGADTALVTKYLTRP